MKVLVTGISGFVGSNLDSYLVKHNYKVFGVSRKTGKKFKFNYQDLSPEKISDFKAIVHLAGKAHDLRKITSSDEYFQINTQLTKTLFNTFLKSDCTVFVFMSSVKACADKVDDLLLEECAANPKSVYGKSKLAAEEYILSKNIPSNKRVYILRPCIIHGPNNKGNLNLLYRFLKLRIPIPLGKFENKRSFVSVDNLTWIIKELIENPVESGIYNIADDEDYSTTDLISLMGKTIGKKVIILNTPKWIVNCLAKIGDVFPLPLNTERLDKLTENYCVSNSKVVGALKKPLPVSAKEGLIKTMNSFK